MVNVNVKQKRKIRSNDVAILLYLIVPSIIAAPFTSIWVPVIIIGP